jgi:hypothetical protein
VSSLLYDPATLGDVDRIDVVAISADTPVGSVNDFVRSEAVEGEVRLTDSTDVERIASLWRALPSGEQARCHAPPFGLRFWLAGKKLLEASICWDCDNVYGYVDNQPLHFAFDSKAPVSVSLLMQCRHMFRSEGA